MDGSGWAKVAIPSVLGGLVVFWAVAGYYHLRYYVLRRHEPERWKCQPKRFLRPEQQRQAIALSTLNLTLGGLVSGTLIYGLGHGLEAPLYFEVARHGWAYTLASTVLLFVLIDAQAYWVHRAFHFRPLFRLIHHWHHRYVATSPFVVTAMHPLEFLTFQAISLLPLFLVPFHYLSAIAVLVYILVFNIIDHSGVRLASRLPWQAATAFHDDHHAHFHVNFGQCFTLWDRLHGTLRRTGRRYGAEVFGGKGAARAPDDKAEVGEPIRY
ncbi:MAG: sterol desaturase family protein [Polyangiaceae bacterium]